MIPTNTSQRMMLFIALFFFFGALQSVAADEKKVDEKKAIAKSNSSASTSMGKAAAVIPTAQEFHVGNALIELRVVPDDSIQGKVPPGTMVIREMLCSAGDIERLVIEQNQKNTAVSAVTILLKEASVSRVHEVSRGLVSRNIGLYRDGILLKSARLVEALYSSIQIPIETTDVPRLTKGLQPLPPPDMGAFRNLLLERKHQSVSESPDKNEKIMLAQSYLNKKQFQEAVNLLAPLEQTYTEREIPGICLVLGGAYRGNNQAEKAVQLYEQCLGKSKKAWSVALDLSQIYAEQKNFEKAYRTLLRYTNNLHRSLNISAARSQLQTLSAPSKDAGVEEKNKLLREQLQKQLHELEAGME